MQPPLYRAVSKGHKEIAVVLIGHGANVEAKNFRGMTPLALAMKEGQAEMANHMRRVHAARTSNVARGPTLG